MLKDDHDEMPPGHVPDDAEIPHGFHHSPPLPGPHGIVLPWWWHWKFQTCCCCCADTHDHPPEQPAAPPITISLGYGSIAGNPGGAPVYCGYGPTVSGAVDVAWQVTGGSGQVAVRLQTIATPGAPVDQTFQGRRGNFTYYYRYAPGTVVRPVSLQFRATATDARGISDAQDFTPHVC